MRAVQASLRILGRSADSPAIEDLRRYQLAPGRSGSVTDRRSTAAIRGLKFFFDVHARRPERMAKMQPVRVPRSYRSIESRTRSRV